MDTTDKKILNLLKRNTRMSYQKLGDAIGMSRVAAKKRVKKLEQGGIIRGYNTYICRDEEITMLIDIVTHTGKCDAVIGYLMRRTAFIRRIFTTTKETHIHIVAVSDELRDLKYLAEKIARDCGNDIEEMQFHTVKEIIKDVYGGIGNEHRSGSDSKGNNGET